MELRVLRYFIEVAREQNITAAAERLHVTQPTLSKQLIDLENELGKKLFVRGKRRTVLTEDGQFLYRRAQEIVDIADKTEAAFRATDEAIAGDVSVGCGETEGILPVIEAMKRVRAAHPDVRFHLYSGNGEDVSARLDDGLVDFGLFVGNIDLDKYDYIRLPYRDTWGLLMPSASPLAEKPHVTPADMEGIPLLCSRQAMLSNEMSGWLGQDFSKLNIISTHNLLHNAAIMVKAGMGYALAIDGLIGEEGGELVFRPLEPRMEAVLTFAWKKHQVFSKAAAKFLKELLALLREREDRRPRRAE